MKPLTLYYYEHCPYCVRVLAAAGLLKIKLNHHVLLNDDEKTPTDLIGVKMVPILALSPEKAMGESLDIIDYLSEFSEVKIEKNQADIKKVELFLQAYRSLLHKLCMPRWVKMPLKEFATSEAIAYFVNKKTDIIGDFDTAFLQTPTLSRDLQAAMAANAELFEDLQTKPNSLAGIMLFSALFGVSGVKDFSWPTAAGAFMHQFSRQAGIALLDDKAV